MGGKARMANRRKTDIHRIITKKTKYMKKAKWMTLLMGLCALMAMTSCLDDNDDKGLTNEQVKKAMQTMKGDYTGTLKWRASTSNNYDSLNNVRWTVNDTAMIIHDFPVSSLAAGVVDGEINDSLRNAMKAAPAQELTCGISFYNTEDFLTPYCVMNIMPYSVLIKDAEINTRLYDLKVNFLNMNSNSMGYFNAEKKAMELYMRTYNLEANNQTQKGNYTIVYYQLVSNNQ